MLAGSLAGSRKKGVHGRPINRIIYVFGSIYLVQNLQGSEPKIPKKTGPGRLGISTAFRCATIRPRWEELATRLMTS